MLVSKVGPPGARILLCFVQHIVPGTGMNDAQKMTGSCPAVVMSGTHVWFQSPHVPWSSSRKIKHLIHCNWGQMGNVKCWSVMGSEGWQKGEQMPIYSCSVFRSIFFLALEECRLIMGSLFNLRPGFWLSCEIWFLSM